MVTICGDDLRLFGLTWPINHTQKCGGMFLESYRSCKALERSQIIPIDPC
jgi:hypothetical protein